MPPELYALLLAGRLMSASLAPLTDERAALSDATAREVWADEPFYRGDEDRVRTLALHIAVAYREGGLQTRAIGDLSSGGSFCAYQIHVSSGGSRELTESAPLCARHGHRMLRASIRNCREAPVAWYAEGPLGCSSERARRISADRVALADRLVRTYAAWNAR
jgi:hypothetical protein